MSLNDLSLTTNPGVTIRESPRNEILFQPGDPLIGTYRGGDGQLFHEWYPLLEGFPPRFVETVLERYARGASVVLDPFAGTGTTPLTVARMGGTGYYCELNPVHQFVTNVKYGILRLDKIQRIELADGMREQADILKLSTNLCEPDTDIKTAYQRVFQRSRYFDEDTLHHLLCLRTYADKLAVNNYMMGRALVVAILASIVPASLMKRAGDLRFKTEHETKQPTTDIFEGISTRLYRMADDVIRENAVSGRGLFVAEDARSLRNIPSLRVDAVVTSPPYPNGTNYFRNVKLELWFLRVLKEREDLAHWRFKAITGGINDVTKAKNAVECPNEVRPVVSQLELSAYDSRIPTMIAAYFGDMKNVLMGMAKHLVQGCTVVVDIGDSRYAGVHVKTDELLCSIATNLGYRYFETQVLRRRKSRDGGSLSQRLIVFKYSNNSQRQATRTSKMDKSMAQRWSDFKLEMPHQKPPFRKRNWGHPLHSLCSYEGKMKPSLAHFLTDIFVPSGGTMLDPFAGAGTIPFEAVLQGRNAFGIELSPAAFSITRGKLHRLDPSKTHQIVSRLLEYLIDNRPSQTDVEATKQINFNKSIDQFYHPNTLKELLVARRFFAEYADDSPERHFVLACLLHILHGNRPYALSRRSHSMTPFAPSGPTEYRALESRLRAKIDRGLRVPHPIGSGTGEVFLQDATRRWPNKIDQLDAVITSPPFFDSTRFYLRNWIRLWFCGWSKSDFSSKPARYVEMRQKQSMRVYENVFRQARERLKPDGVVVLHLGKSNKKDMAVALGEIAKPWFRIRDVFEESVIHTETHGVRDKGGVTGHQFLILN